MRLITLKGEPFPKDQLGKKLEEQGIFINESAGRIFAHPAFSTEQTREMTVAIATLGELGLEEGGTLDEISRQAEKFGLRPCPMNTGVFLRLSWREQPQSQNSILSGTHQAPDGAVTVLSEPLEADDAFPKGLYLRNVDGRLWLRGYRCDLAYRFPGDALFAFEKV